MDGTFMVPVVAIVPAHVADELNRLGEEADIPPQLAEVAIRNGWTPASLVAGSALSAVFREAHANEDGA